MQFLKEVVQVDSKLKDFKKEAIDVFQSAYDHFEELKDDVKTYLENRRSSESST
jgi:hypothetical protein